MRPGLLRFCRGSACLQASGGMEFGGLGNSRGSPWAASDPCFAEVGSNRRHPYPAPVTSTPVVHTSVRICACTSASRLQGIEAFSQLEVTPVARGLGIVILRVHARGCRGGRQLRAPLRFIRRLFQKASFQMANLRV